MADTIKPEALPVAEKVSAPAAEPAVAQKSETDELASEIVPHWPPLTPSHPLLALNAKLGDILKAAGHDTIWGVTLSQTPTFATFLILQKYLRSVANDVDAAGKNLEATLKWRKEFGLDTGVEEPQDPVFDGLGYVSEVNKWNKREVITWNIYGAVDIKATFGDTDKFLRWRIALMERAMARLHLATTTIPIPDHGAGDDPHRLGQVHVHTGVSFLRMPPEVKTASKATIALMSAHYPETLSRKFFVGVPLIMSWMFTAMKLFVNADTAKKFVVISYETNLCAELSDDSDDVPVVYGGSGPDLVQLEQRPEKVMV